MPEISNNSEKKDVLKGMDIVTSPHPESQSDYINDKVRNVLRMIVLTAGITAVTGGLLVLAGWIFGIDIFRRVSPSVISIKFNTALCLILLGSALLLEELWLGKKYILMIISSISLIVIILSTLTLLEYFFRWDAGIDNLVFKDNAGDNLTIFPGRMAFGTCISFILLGLSFLFLNSQVRSLLFISRILPLVSVLFGLIPILGYLYKDPQLLNFGFYTNMSPYSSFLIIVLSLGVTCIWNFTGFLSVLRFSGPGGYMARKLIPLTVLIPIVFIWIRLLLQPAGTHGGSLDLLVLSLTYIAVFSFFIWRIAWTVNAIDKNRIDSESALRQSEKRFYLAFHSSPASLVITTFNEGIIIDSNDAYSKLTGIPADELRGKSTRSLNLWADLSERDHMIAEMAKNGKAQNLEIRMNNKGSVRTALASFESIMLNGEKCIISSALDITDWKRAQDLIVASEKQNLLANEILEHLNGNTDSVLMIQSVIKSIRESTGYEAVGIRLKNGEDYPYFQTDGFNADFVNSERFLCSYDKSGKIIRDASNNPLLECMCGNVLSNRVDASKSFFTEGGSFRSNNTTLLLATTTDNDRMARTRNRCNSSGYESVALIPLRSGSDIIGLLQLNDHRPNMFDETIIPFFERLGSSIGIAVMRNKAENELKSLNTELEKRVAERTEQLMYSNKELESFAYSVSHDLRAPLRHLTGFSEILESEIGGMMNPEIRRVTDIIKNAAKRMSHLIDDLLSYSRAGRNELRSETISLNPMIDEIIVEATETIKNRNIEWKINSLPDVKADKLLLRLVLQNLINNAIKFTSKKENAIIEINYRKENNGNTTYYIKDNGAGFNMDYAGKLFGVFQRLHTDKEFEGTGIGLATVLRILRKHGGTITAEGVVNEGAVFYFTMPV
jgi:PAS domain S-box-containing protein